MASSFNRVNIKNTLAISFRNTSVSKLEEEVEEEQSLKST